MFSDDKLSVKSLGVKVSSFKQFVESDYKKYKNSKFSTIESTIIERILENTLLYKNYFCFIINQINAENPAENTNLRYLFQEILDNTITFSDFKKKISDSKLASEIDILSQKLIKNRSLYSFSRKYFVDIRIFNLDTQNIIRIVNFESSRHMTIPILTKSSVFYHLYKKHEDYVGNISENIKKQTTECLLSFLNKIFTDQRVGLVSSSLLENILSILNRFKADSQVKEIQEKIEKKIKMFFKNVNIEKFRIRFPFNPLATIINENLEQEHDFEQREIMENTKEKITDNKKIKNIKIDHQFMSQTCNWCYKNTNKYAVPCDCIVCSKCYKKNTDSSCKKCSLDLLYKD